MNDLAVLIPAYNDNNALTVTLDSIKEENYDFIVLIIDDGSPEPIFVEHNRYPFDVEVIRLDNNLGITGALNTGLRYLSQKENIHFIARLDCGDLNAENRFSIQRKLLIENDDLMLVGSNVEFFDTNNIDNNFYTSLPIKNDEIKKNVWLKNCFVHPAVIFRKVIFNQVGYYDPQAKYIEDYVLFSKIINMAKTENIPNYLVRCEIRTSGISVKREREQAISGLKWKLQAREFKNIYWCFSIIKSIVRVILRRRMMNKLKKIMRIIK
ncbi:glycosyltransferase [Aeromonas veronii]